MPYLLLFWEFFKIGLFTFGGGLAMIPLVKDAVITNSWLTEAEFYDFIGICESTPGPIAVNMATYVGSTQGGLFGCICAVLGVVLPSVIIIILIASLLKNFTKNKYFKGFLRGVKPIIVGLLLSTGLILLAKCFGYVSLKQFNFKLVSTICFGIITGLYFFVTKVLKKKISSISLIVIAACLGIVISYIA